MADEEMIERVARAIHFRGDDQGDDAWNYCQNSLRVLAREQARAAIEAIRSDGAAGYRVKNTVGMGEYSFYEYLHGAVPHSQGNGNPVEFLYVLPSK
ncbi:hypothetical protein [Mesorhizobium sp. Pch-S]|uniref:hypothetical protein n=1 Tax=Mesorhizobium sp. Pch-S TaxID=2082387 RepID=UPI001011B3D3|nr:hypothetical protein [Mesorhizobium sp. Pch-S]QAZ46743.1 hypothetical protein C1M53_31310 [Mesorhizobium sp. Pch-S]QAZ46807.1 hypothetical protein C1M53_31640 [Mesorhizobium sp. Pch-S]